MMDLISRQALLDWIKYHDNESEDLFPVFKHVKNMPSVQPEIKKGHWTTKRTWEHDGEIYCSICGYNAPTEGDYRQVETNYCPHCGADMKGENNDDCQK